jgi:hypothetical protein
MILRSDGKVGIGTTSPSMKLHVSNANQPSDDLGTIQAENTTASSAVSTSMTIKNYSGTSQFMQWQNFGLRIGSRILTNSGQGAVVFTYASDTEGMRIASDGKIGIGTSLPTAQLEVLNSSGNTATFRKTTGESYLTLGGTSTDYASINNINGGGLTFSTGNGTLSERLKIDTSGNLLPSVSSLLGSAGNPWGAIHTNTGIQLGGGGTANLLDDYEEGNWTPVFTSGGQTATLAVANCTYTKVGRQVTVNIDQLAWSALSGAFSSSVKITGLPFLVGGRSACTIVGTGLSNTGANTKVVGMAEHNQTYILILEQNDTTGSYGLSGPVVASSGVIFGVTVSYHVN